MSVDRNLKLKKYILLGRKLKIKNLNQEGEDIEKTITEVFKLKPNTVDHNGEWREYERYIYHELKGGRGMDVGLEEGMSYISVDGTVGDFIDFNFDTTELETHEVRFCKTYNNKKFISRDRKTTYHAEIDFDQLIKKMQEDDDA